MGRFYRVAKVQDIDLGKGVSSEVEGRSIAIFNLDGEFYAISNDCPHQGAPLAEGEIESAHVVCPWHAWSFDIKTGVCGENSKICIPRYNLKIEGDDVWVEV